MLSILFTKLSHNFDGDIVCLDFLVCASVGSGVSNTVGSGAVLGVGSGVKILSRFFIGNMLLLQLLRISFLALKK